MHLQLNWIEQRTSNPQVAGSSPARCTSRTTHSGRDSHSQRNSLSGVFKSAILHDKESEWGIVFVLPNAPAEAIVGSQRKSRTYQGIQLSWLERYVDIVEVTGSSPVLPIRQNKKWGKEIVMNVCLTQPNRFAGHVDSQRNILPFKSQLIRPHRTMKIVSVISWHLP